MSAEIGCGVVAILRPGVFRIGLQEGFGRPHSLDGWRPAITSPRRLQEARSSDVGRSDDL